MYYLVDLHIEQPRLPLVVLVGASLSTTLSVSREPRRTDKVKTDVNQPRLSTGASRELARVSPATTSTMAQGVKSGNECLLCFANVWLVKLGKLLLRFQK